LRKEDALTVVVPMMLSDRPGPTDWKSRRRNLSLRGFRLQDQPPRKAKAPPLSAA
jgi:hypothetical protein